MTGATFTLRVDDAEVQGALDRLAARVTDLTPALRAIGSVLESGTMRRFETETAPDGQRWLPSQRAQREGGQTLTDTARLRHSITSQVSGSEVEVGTNVVYAAIHQMGGDIRHPGRAQTVQYSVLTKAKGKLRPGMWRFRRARDAGKKGVQSRQVEIGARVVRIPARPYLGLSAADQAGVLEAIRDHLDLLGGGDAP